MKCKAIVYCSRGRAVSQEEDPFLVQHSTAQRKGGGQLERVDCNWLDKDRCLTEDDEKSYADDKLHLQTKQGFDGKSNLLSHAAAPLKKCTAHQMSR